MAPVELRMGCIHQHVVAIGDGAVDGAMQMRFQFRPRALHIGSCISPQLFPQHVIGDHPCREQRSEDRREGGLAAVGGPINRWPWGRGSGNEAFVEPAHQSTNHGHWSKRGADEIEIIAVVPDLSIWIEAEPGRRWA